MEHVAALVDDATVPPEVRAAARQLRETPPQAPALVQLGAPDPAPWTPPSVILDWAARAARSLGLARCRSPAGRNPVRSQLRRNG